MTRDLQPCGTRAAYKRHLANREVPCDACNRANSVNIARYRAQRDMAAREQRALFHELLDLIAGQCREAGMLP